MKKASGNMYPFIDYTWNPVRGKCPYECVYCYTGRWGDLPPLHLDSKVLNENLGKNNFIFICSGCDLFHPDIPDDWISAVIAHAKKFNNQYLLHTKNPGRALLWNGAVNKNFILCVTIESNSPPPHDLYPFISKAPPPASRFRELKKWAGRRMIAIEPILQFEIETFAQIIIETRPEQVNIGADSGKNNLPEPSPWIIERLIELLKPHTKILLKENLRRIYSWRE
jgi:DNA repair photolyase